MQDLFQQAKAFDSELTTPPSGPRTQTECGRVYGAVLTVGLERDLGDKIRGKLLDLGLMALATPSEVVALQLLHRGEIFDAIVVSESRGADDALPFVRQIRSRCSNIPIVVVASKPETSSMLQSLKDSALRGLTTEQPAAAIAKALVEVIEQSREPELRVSGVMRASPLSPRPSAAH